MFRWKRRLKLSTITSTAAVAIALAAPIKLAAVTRKKCRHPSLHRSRSARASAPSTLGCRAVHRPRLWASRPPRLPRYPRLRRRERAVIIRNCCGNRRRRRITTTTSNGTIIRTVTVSLALETVGQTRDYERRVCVYVCVLCVYHVCVYVCVCLRLWKKTRAWATQVR